MSVLTDFSLTLHSPSWSTESTIAERGLPSHESHQTRTKASFEVGAATAPFVLAKMEFLWI